MVRVSVKKIVSTSASALRSRPHAPTRAHTNDTGLEEEFRQVCANMTPVQLVWGEKDASVPIAHCTQLEAIANEAGCPVQKTTFEDGPHGVFYGMKHVDQPRRHPCTN